MSLNPGDVLWQDPDEEQVVTFNWTAALADAETISTSTYTIEDAPDAELTKDNPSILSGSLKTQIRILGGTLHAQYKLTNLVVTTSSPAQTLSASLFIRVRSSA